MMVQIQYQVEPARMPSFVKAVQTLPRMHGICSPHGQPLPLLLEQGRMNS
jgi:hypothetical protein